MRSQNQVWVGQKGATSKMQHAEEAALLRTYCKILEGGKAYMDRKDQSELRASTEYASGSGIGLKYNLSLVLSAVEKASTMGVYNFLQMSLKTDGCRLHSVCCNWPFLDSLSAMTLRAPGIWRACKVIFHRLATVKTSHDKGVHSPNSNTSCLSKMPYCCGVVT